MEGGKRGEAYKTQTVKGVGVASPEVEAGRGLLTAVVMVSAIMGVRVCGRFCSTGSFLVSCKGDGERLAGVPVFYTWPS